MCQNDDQQPDKMVAWLDEAHSLSPDSVWSAVIERTLEEFRTRLACDGGDVSVVLPTRYVCGPWRLNQRIMRGRRRQ